MAEPLPLNELVERCGYFTSDTKVNNGYGCLHPENESREGGAKVGSCYSFSCPVAGALSTNEPRDVEIMRVAGYEEDEWSDDGDWMFPFIELTDHRYVYLGDRLTDPRLVGRLCDPIRRPDGKCIVGRPGGPRNQLVRFDNGEVVVVVARRLRLRRN
jgi:hypothetical protein